MKKVRCAITGLESDWFEASIYGQAVPEGWAVVSWNIVMQNRRRMTLEICVCPDAARRLSLVDGFSEEQQAKDCFKNLFSELIGEIVGEEVNNQLSNR